MKNTCNIIQPTTGVFIAAKKKGFTKYRQDFYTSQLEFWPILQARFEETLIEKTEMTGGVEYPDCICNHTTFRQN